MRCLPRMRRVDRGQRVGPDWVGNSQQYCTARPHTLCRARPVFCFLSFLSPPPSLFSRNTAFFFAKACLYSVLHVLCTMYNTSSCFIQAVSRKWFVRAKLSTAVVAPRPLCEVFPPCRTPSITMFVELHPGVVRWTTASYVRM